MLLILFISYVVSAMPILDLKYYAFLSVCNGTWNDHRSTCIYKQF